MARNIHKFVRSTRLLERSIRGVVAILTHALGLGFVLLIVGFVWPEWSRLGLWMAAAWLGAVALYRMARRGRPIEDTDRALGLKDRLSTWWVARGEGSAALAWLEADLDAQLAAMPGKRRSVLWRRQTRRLWWLLPILLIVWTIGPLGRSLLMDSETGSTQVSDRGSGATPETGPGGGGKPREGGSAPGSQDPKPEQAPQPEQPHPKQTQPKQPPQNPVQPPGKEQQLPPKPIPELASQEQFVIPRVIGAGTGKRQRMKVAITEQSDPDRARRVAATKRKVADDEAARRLEFQTAAERAIRSRHVPRSERPFVKRYFQELLEGRK